MNSDNLKEYDKNTAKEDLAYIRKIMEDANEVVHDFSFFFILFGSLVVIGSIFTQILLLLKLPDLIMHMWFIIMGIGTAFAFIKASKIDRSIKSLAGRVLSTTWLSVFIIIFVIGLSVVLIGKMTLSLGLGITAAGLGLGFFISSRVSNSKLLLFLSIPWWLGGIFIPFLGDIYGPATMTGLTLFFELIPGVIMMAKKRKSRSLNGKK